MTRRGFLAYVVAGDAVHEKVLKLGLHTAEGWVEVREGLKAGDVLVTKGLEALAEGTKVRVVQPGAPASRPAVAGAAGGPGAAPAAGGAPRTGRGGPRAAAKAP
jgi:hypothetical protein